MVFLPHAEILAGGQVIEDIDYYHRVHEAMIQLQSKQSRENDDAEGFGGIAPTHGGHAILFEDTLDVNLTYPYGKIAPSSTKNVLFRLLSGILNQDKYLRIRYCPIQIELELVNNMLDPITEQASYMNGATAAIGEAEASTQWEIEDVQVRCDVVTLDNALDNEYAQHLISGKSLPINFNTYVSQIQVLAGQKPYSNIACSMTRLKSVFIIFDADHTSSSGVPTLALWTPFLKDWNVFYHPMLNAVGSIYDPTLEVEFQLQIGSKLVPEYPVRSVSESFYQLRKCLGDHHTNFHSVDKTADAYSR